MSLILALALLFPASVAGHGYMSEPPSRNFQAWENNGWDKPGPDEYEPHSVRAAHMKSACADCADRGVGATPWSAPGTAPSLSFNTSNALQGVCGAAWTADLDYNSPSPFDVFGVEAARTYAPGEVFDVEWCVSADHGGVPQFRLCADEALVSALTTPGYTPSLEDHEALEACFQDGLLRCDAVGVDERYQTCGQVAACAEHPSWEACADPGKYTHCVNELGTSSAAYSCRNTNEQCGIGTKARYTLKIPEDFPASAHTVMSWRWDTYNNEEVFAGCADIAISTDKTTTPRPSAVALQPSAFPVAAPTQESDCVCPPADASAEPTEAPTEAPTDEPTDEPTDAGDCVDETSFLEIGREANDERVRNCDWVALKPNTRCPAYKLVCPVTCDACGEPCVDATTFTEIGSDPVRVRDCEWVGEKPNNRCPAYEVLCPVTCGVCDGEPTDAPKDDAPTEPPTSSPAASPTGNSDCGCRSKVSHISDAWCVSVGCDSVYAAYCTASCDGDATTGEPAPAPTAPTPAAEPAPAPTAPTQRPTSGAPAPRPTSRPTREEGHEGDFVVAGYVENWKTWDTGDLDGYNTLLYSFLTLDPQPNPDQPRDLRWDGVAIYESMTRADVLDVMDATEPLYENPHNWQRQKIVGLMDFCAATGKRFVWAFGGWSDLKRTIADDQVDALVDQLVALLKLGGDGIDFDWEHLSDAKDSDPALYAQQRVVVGKVIVALKDALVAEGMDDAIISYTPRYNAFFTSDGAFGNTPIRTDGEGIDVLNYVSEHSTFGADAIDYVHYMMYDIDAREGFAEATDGYFVEEHYDAVIESSLPYIDVSKIVMGFEPGPQAYTGKWGGEEHDRATIALLRPVIGGVMFWAVNDVKVSPQNGRTVGQNSNALAAYAAGL